ncbi:MAG: aminotransferase class III-fold pyridoxal phosphate-dependent enzyme [Pyrinomonadaceae bacterium]
MNQAEQKTTVSEAVRKHKEFLFQAVATYYQEPLALVKGEGEYVWDDAGNRYLDCFGGVLTVSVGHANPKINAAIIEQVNKIAHTSALYANPNQSDLAEKLAEISPGDLKKSFFTSSGTEADDTAIMAAKLATGRQEIVVLRHSYSGRSATALSSTTPDIRRGDRCPRRLPESFTPARRIAIAARFICRRQIAVWLAPKMSKT